MSNELNSAPHNAGQGPRLSGRRIVITGAGSGIGKAIAELFAEHGAQLALLDLNIDAALPIAQRCDGIALRVDVADENSVNAAIDAAAAALGGIDGVVNAAGVISVGTLEATDLQSWRRQIDINLTGPYLICRAALPWLRKAGAATIVNIASAQAIRPVGASCAYAASKAGVLNFTKALAGELAPAIRANVVCPGIVDTPMVAQVSRAAGNPTSTPTLKDYPLARMAQALEIANAILFLTSAESSYITGAALAVDGGRTFH
jgi:NAD(P)-dependent dehydrogenase (short-subunit alcohol dehydrogenase family)